MWVRQTLAGFSALVFSLAPFGVFFSQVPEGRAVWHRATVGLAPPELPSLPTEERAWLREHGPAYRGGVAVLVYHGLGDGDDWDGARQLSTERFGEQLVALDAAGMQTITATEFVETCQVGGSFPPNAVMLTFDDARSRALLDADRLLGLLEMTATVFVTTEAASSGSVFYADWSRISRAASSGRWDVQSHTADSHRHQQTADGQRLPVLTSLAPGESLDAYARRVRGDLAEAAEAIRANTGEEPVAFSYPFGAHGADERTNHASLPSVLRSLVEEHATIAFHQDQQADVPLARCDDDLLDLRRLDVKEWSGVRLVAEVAAMASNGR